MSSLPKTLRLSEAEKVVDFNPDVSDPRSGIKTTLYAVTFLKG